MRGAKPDLKAIDGGLSHVPPAPRSLPDEAKAEWDRAAQQLVEAGLLMESDLIALEQYSIAIGMVRRLQPQASKEPAVIATQTGGLKTNPVHTMLARYMTVAKGYAAELGLTPASRHRKGMKSGSEAHASAPPGLDL
jgi:P27 family predicted phage terminase small subunit